MFRTLVAGGANPLLEGQNAELPPAKTRMTLEAVNKAGTVTSVSSRSGPAPSARKKRTRSLPPTRIDGLTMQHSLIADGCMICRSVMLPSRWMVKRIVTTPLSPVWMRSTGRCAWQRSMTARSASMSCPVTVPSAVCPSAKVTVEVDPAPEVKISTAERSGGLLGRSFIPADRVSAQAYASFDEATVITVPAEADASRPTVVTVTGDGGTGYGHLLVQAEPFSRAVVVLDHRGSATYADNVELVVGDSASLSVVSLQDWADDAVHLTQHYATLGRDARLRHAAVTTFFGHEFIGTVHEVGPSVQRLSVGDRVMVPFGSRPAQDAQRRGDAA